MIFSKRVFFILFLFIGIFANPVSKKKKFVEQGANEWIISIKQSDFYGFEVKSKYGTSIEVVDKMLGPIEKNGSIGYEDGKCYLFLARGKYKLKLFSITNNNSKKKKNFIG